MYYNLCKKDVLKDVVLKNYKCKDIIEAHAIVYLETLAAPVSAYTSKCGDDPYEEILGFSEWIKEHDVNGEKIYTMSQYPMTGEGWFKIEYRWSYLLTDSSGEKHHIYVGSHMDNIKKFLDEKRKKLIG
jgi:hypothetical protein